jgi:integrase
VVRTSKNNHLRTVPISKWLLNYLEQLKKYKTSTIIPISQNAFIKRWQKALKKLKMHMHIHDFRRNFVQSLVNKKVDIPTIARLTGHSSWQQVQLYWGER